MSRILCLAILLTAFAPQERGKITITTLDRSFEVQKLEIRESAGSLVLTATDAADAVTKIPGPDVVEIGFDAPESRPAAGADDVEILLRTGDRLVGSLGDPAPEAIQLISPSLGATPVPFGNIDQVRFLSHRAEWPRAVGEVKGDTLFTASGDKPSGAIKSIGRGSVVYHNARRDRDVTLATKDLLVVCFVPIPPNPDPPPATLYAIVQLTDGSEIRGTLKAYGAGGLTFTDLYKTERTIAPGKVAGLYFKNGRVIYLSDLAASKVDENPNYIRAAEPLPGDLAYPWQRDANAGDAGPLRIRNQEFRKGIGVHARSSLTFAIDGGFSRFQALLGIDDHAIRLTGQDPVGNVTFVVSGDGKVLERKEGVTSRTAPVSLSVDIKGVKELTLLVDFGEDRSGQGDFADWALARIIR
ncbi:MAG TPA: NPCBM/NEW2 domain-containing protein [Planctomycetota bacterium]|nr:NPCBM/NEW2 domain-containing protein [Planctomycetota bacterium]